MVVTDPDHWVEPYYLKGPKYDKIIEIITAVNLAGGIGAHSTTHELLGSDVINVAGLSGLLGDAQTPISHNNTYHSETYATTAQLHSQSHDNTDHTTNYEVANANIQSHVATPAEDAHHPKDHDNTEHTTNYATALALTNHEGASNPHAIAWSDVSGGHDAASHNSISVTALSDVTAVGSGSIITTVERQGLHAQGHQLTGLDHNASGLTVGWVVRATAATTFAWAQLQHSDLGGSTPDLHHAESHTHDSHTGVLSANEGGTGQSVYVVGDILYAATTTTLARLAAATSSWVLTSQGAGSAPIWQAPGAPGNHNLDSASHEDVSAVSDHIGLLLYQAVAGTWSGLTAPATVGHLLKCTNVNGSIAWGAPSSGDIWEDQSIEVHCPLEGVNQVAAANYCTFYTGGFVANLGANDLQILFGFPLPTAIGSLRFYCTSIRVHLDDADTDDMVNTVRGIQYEGASVTSTLLSTASFNTAGEHTVTVNAYLNAAYGEGGMYKIFLDTDCTSFAALDILGVSVIGYYT